MLKWIVVVVLIAAVAAGVWLLGGSDRSVELGSAGGGGGSAQALSPGDPGDPVDLTAATGSPGGGAQGARSDGLRSSVPEDELARQAAARAAADGELVVLALHPGNQQPLADLDVWLLDRDSRPAVEWQVAFQALGPRLDYLRAHGMRYTTDLQGQVSVPRVASGAVLVEGQGQRGEFAWAGPVQSPIKVRLRPKVDLQVRVVDVEGALVPGVPVAIVDNVTRRPRQRAMRPTTANGEAAFTYLSKALGDKTGGVGYAIILNFPQSNPERVPLDPANLPEEAVEMVMPPAAPMRFELRDAAGEAIKGPTTIALGSAGLDGSGQRSTTRTGFQVQVQQRTSSGATRFNWIEVGAAFDVLVTGAGTRADQVFQVTGPPVADELYTLELVWDSQHPTLVGRAVGPDGRALARRHGRLRLTENRASRQSSAFLCDENGRFEIRIDESWTPGSERVGVVSMTQTDEAGPLEAQLDLSFEVAPGETDLGNVVFTGIPRLASGRVLDEDGSPMAGAHAVAQYRKAGADEDAWRNVDGAADTTGPDGWFTVYGEPVSKDLRISVRRRGFESGESPFEAGDQNVLLTLSLGNAPEDQEAAGEEPSDK